MTMPTISLETQQSEFTSVVEQTQAIPLDFFLDKLSQRVGQT
jgi:hypothetical protein